MSHTNNSKLTLKIVFEMILRTILSMTAVFAGIGLVGLGGGWVVVGIVTLALSVILPLMPILPD